MRLAPNTIKDIDMKAYLVKRVFAEGIAEGVMFTDKRDAIDAMSGRCEQGATLAIEWCDLYGEDSDKFELTEIDI